MLFRSGEVCIRTFYDDGDVALLTFATLLIVTFWILGMLNFLEGVADIAPPFDMRVRIWGVGGGGCGGCWFGNGGSEGSVVLVRVVCAGRSVWGDGDRCVCYAGGTGCGVGGGGEG